jgi:hypothetical protein
MIATATAEAVNLLSINRRSQMRQTIDFQNQQPTNILAQLLVTTRRPQSEWRIGDVVGSPQQSSQRDDWRAAA